MGQKRGSTRRRKVLQLDDSKKSDKKRGSRGLDYNQPLSQVVDEDKGLGNGVREGGDGESTERMDSKIANFLKEINALGDSEDSEITFSQSQEINAHDDSEVSRESETTFCPSQEIIASEVSKESEITFCQSQEINALGDSEVSTVSEITFWQEVVDPTTNHSYYWHPQTNEVTWTLPENGVISDGSVEPPSSELHAHVSSHEGEATYQETAEEQEGGQAEIGPQRDEPERLQQQEESTEIVEEKEGEGEKEMEEGEEINALGDSEVSTASEVTFWQEVVDPSTNHSYWWNPQTNEVTWTLPENGVISDASPSTPLSKHADQALRLRVSTLADKLSRKLHHLGVGAEGTVSDLQELSIQLETRLADWMDDGLSSKFMLSRLKEASLIVQQYEDSAAPPGWKCDWDSTSCRYKFRNLSTGEISWEYPLQSLLSPGSVEPPSSELSSHEGEATHQEAAEEQEGGQAEIGPHQDEPELLQQAEATYQETVEEQEGGQAEIGPHQDEPEQLQQGEAMYQETVEEQEGGQAEIGPQQDNPERLQQQEESTEIVEEEKEGEEEKEMEEGEEDGGRKEGERPSEDVTEQSTLPTPSTRPTTSKSSLEPTENEESVPEGAGAAVVSGVVRGKEGSRKESHTFDGHHDTLSQKKKSAEEPKPATSQTVEMDTEDGELIDECEMEIDEADHGNASQIDNTSAGPQETQTRPTSQKNATETASSAFAGTQAATDYHSSPDRESASQIDSVASDNTSAMPQEAQIVPTPQESVTETASSAYTAYSGTQVATECYSSPDRENASRIDNVASEAQILPTSQEAQILPTSQEGATETASSAYAVYAGTQAATDYYSAQQPYDYSAYAQAGYGYAQAYNAYLQQAAAAASFGGYSMTPPGQYYPASYPAYASYGSPYGYYATSGTAAYSTSAPATVYQQQQVAPPVPAIQPTAPTSFPGHPTQPGNEATTVQPPTTVEASKKGKKSKFALPGSKEKQVKSMMEKWNTYQNTP